MNIAAKSPVMDQSLDARRILISPIVKSRGARFLDLVRQNKLNVSPQLKKRISLTEAAAEQKAEEICEKDFLKITNSPFNPLASPSSGILSKRKNDTPEPSSSAKVSVAVSSIASQLYNPSFVEETCRVLRSCLNNKTVFDN